jgi:integrase/recombinase XerD
MDVIVTIAEYKNHLKVRGYAQSTVACYSRGIDLFGQYLQSREITDLRAVNKQIIFDYQAKIMERPIAQESKALEIRPVKRLFEYLMDNNHLLINPAESIVETNRTNRKIGSTLTVAEMQKLLNAPNLSLRTGIRDKAVLELLYCTAIRKNELLNLEVYHADLKDQVLYVRKAKGRKQRVVPLGNNATKYLKEYLEKIRPHYAKKNPKERKLFLSNAGLPLTGGALQCLIRTQRIAAGIKKPVSAHAFRRSCATHLIQQGADVRYVQKLLGHSRLKTTQFYTKVMPVEVKQTHEKTHPQIEANYDH